MLSLFRSFSTKRIAIVLSGCGVYDGTELTQAVSVFIHLSKNKVLYQCYAPDIPQAHVINHLTGTQTPQQRNVLQQTARISRGNVKDLSKIEPENYDALILPGGFGAAKNLSSFGFKGSQMSVISQVHQTIEKFYIQKKPIAACCIAPVLLAKTLGSKSGYPGVQLTLGKKRNNEDWPFSQSIEVADNFGNKLVECDTDDVHVDESAKIITTPAYMKGTAKPHEIFEGIGKMVEKLLKLT